MKLGEQSIYIPNMLQVGIWTRNTHIFKLIHHVHQTENTLSFSPFRPLVESVYAFKSSREYQH
jgi:hypothetical protein